MASGPEYKRQYAVKNTPHKETDHAAQLSVGFVLLPHFTLLPFAAFIDALRIAADEGDQSRQINCRWTVMGPDLEEVDSSCCVNVRPWETFRPPKEFDYIVVVGGLLHQGPTTSKAVLDYLRLAAEQSVTLVGVCTGSFALIRAGLMSGRRCCVAWFHYQDMLAEFSDVIPVSDRVYVDDGDRITCAGGTIAADIASLIIERHLGRNWARKSLRFLAMDEVRSSNTAQAQPTTEFNVKDERVKRALLIMQQNMERPLSSAELSAAMNLSTRQLERLFISETKQSMQKNYRNIRLAYGMWMLQNSDRTVTNIAQECGFSDTAHFTRAFKALFDSTPSSVRP